MSEPVDFCGQWTGRSEGEPPGRVILDIDLVSGEWRGSAHLIPDSMDIPSSVIFFSQTSSLPSISSKAAPRHYNAGNGRFLTGAEISSSYPGVDVPPEVDFNLQLDPNGRLIGRWRSSIETSGEIICERECVKARSSVVAESGVSSWESFKSELMKFRFGDRIFRGQGDVWPLQTSFHRTRRKDLHRYLLEDIPKLHHAVTSRIDHLFDLHKPVELGAFLNLLQHHGYPTPLLDWTYSPFVAAWFAYSDSLVQRERPEMVRIFSMSKGELQKFNQFQTLTLAPPHISLLEALAIKNDRAGPQQGVLTLTNLANIERHIASLEESGDVKILTAYDLPAHEAEAALNDLALMGITRSTMFPGMDSICRDFRDSLFR